MEGSTWKLEKQEEIHDSLLDGGRDQRSRVVERLDIEVTWEGQWSVSVEPQGPTQSPSRPLNIPLTGATGPS